MAAKPHHEAGMEITEEMLLIPPPAQESAAPATTRWPALRRRRNLGNLSMVRRTGFVLKPAHVRP
jgi:hypothetical protein